MNAMQTSAIGTCTSPTTFFRPPAKRGATSAQMSWSWVQQLLYYAAPKIIIARAVVANSGCCVLLAKYQCVGNVGMLWQMEKCSREV